MVYILCTARACVRSAYAYRTCSIIRPPFLHRSSAKKKGGGRLIEVLHLCPELTPPPPNATKWFPGNSLYCAAHAESRGCHKITIIIVHNSQLLQTRDGRIVGHVTPNWQGFLVHSSVTCRITDVRRRSEGKGLVVPCVYIFRGKTNHLEKLFAIFPQVT